MDFKDWLAVATKRPEHYAYWGDFEFDEWASVIGHHRDSYCLDESNYQVIKEDLESQWPEDVIEESSNHFLVGWSEVVRVRVYRPAPFVGRIFTEAIKAAHAWHCAMENYPVADEEDFSRREMEAFSNCVELESNQWPESIERPEDWVYRVAQLCDETSEDPSYRMIESAITEAAADYFNEVNYPKQVETLFEGSEHA